MSERSLTLRNWEFQMMDGHDQRGMKVDVIDGFALGAGPSHFFFLVLADSELVRYEIIILGTIRLPPIRLSLHFLSLQRLLNKTFSLSESLRACFS